MGLFDHIRCKYKAANGPDPKCLYQTKDTPAQYLEEFEIREDGTLWHHKPASYEDVRTEEEKNLPGLASLCGMSTPVGHQWVQLPTFTGEVCFYGLNCEWSAYFVKGQIKHLERIDDDSQV